LCHPRARSATGSNPEIQHYHQTLRVKVIVNPLGPPLNPQGQFIMVPPRYIPFIYLLDPSKLWKSRPQKKDQAHHTTGRATTRPLVLRYTGFFLWRHTHKNSRNRSRVGCGLQSVGNSKPAPVSSGTQLCLCHIYGGIGNMYTMNQRIVSVTT